MGVEHCENCRDMPLLVAAAVIIREDRVLLTKRPAGKRHAGFWEFPGGKVHPDESPAGALCREMHEELGAGVEVGQVFDVVYYRYDWGPVLILAYSCSLLNDALKNIDVADHRWVSADEFSDYKILPADQPVLCRLTEILS